MTWTVFPSDRLGYMTEPSALASALCVVKNANTEPYILDVQGFRQRRRTLHGFLLHNDIDT
jgi:hypothetical protein